MNAERELLYTELINESSNTPLVELSKLTLTNGNRIFLKLEYKNPVGSIHMRVYPYVFKKAEVMGFIEPELTPVIEASFGNAGAAFTYCAKRLGFDKPTPPTVIIPGNISNTRLLQLKELGANLIVTPSERYNIGYVERLEEELAKDRQKREISSRIDPTRLYPITKTRKDAKEAYKNLVAESLESITKICGSDKSTIDIFIGVVGSGTSISGIGERLKELNPEVKIVATESSVFRNTSSLLDNGVPLKISEVPEGFPPLTAIGVPINKLNLNSNIIDEVQQFNIDSMERLIEVIKKEYGISIGYSTAGPLLTAIKMCERTINKNYLICAYDEYRKWK